MKMGAFQPSLSVSILPSFRSFVPLPPPLLGLRRPPTFAMEIYLWTRIRLPRQTASRPLTNPVAWQAGSSHFCNANAVLRRVARQ